MTTPGTWNIEVYQGDDYTWTLTFQDSVPAAIDITGWVFLAQLRSTAGSDTVIGVMTVTITDAANGVASLHLDKDVSTVVPTGGCVYDIEVTDASGEVRTWIKGTMTLVQGVSRA